VSMWLIDVEVHPEMAYDLYQQDVDEWTGSRVNYQGHIISKEQEKKGF